MKKLFKRVVGTLGLGIVVGATMLASGLPPTPSNKTYAADSNVNISITVVDNAVASILSPTNNSLNYASSVPAINVSYSDIKTINIDVSGPNGYHSSFSDDRNGGITSGSGSIMPPFSPTEFGDYIVSLSGTNMSDAAIKTSSVKFSYHAITVVDNGGGNLDITYGSATDSVVIQVYAPGDVGHQHPLLNPEYVVDNLGAGGTFPNTINVNIPGFAGLGEGEFEVVVTAVDAGSNNLESVPFITDGMIAPPKTGALNILGVTVGQTEYLVVGLIAFVLIAMFALGLFKRSGRRR